MSDDLRTRIAAVLAEAQETNNGISDLALADAVIATLDGEFISFGLWLAEEITGRTMTRIDMESCLQDWKQEKLLTDNNIHDRIAAVLKAEAERRGIYKIADFDFPFMADAVIRELKLEREHWQYGDGRTMGIRYRYVTEWQEESNG